MSAERLAERSSVPNITCCPLCSGLYEASSEETSVDPDRRCPRCIGPRALARYRHPHHDTEREREACSICAAAHPQFPQSLTTIGRALDDLEEDPD